MKARLVWLVLCGIWGSTWLFIKLGLEDLPPLTFAGIRFVISCAIILSIIRIRGLQLPRARADWLLLAVTGILSFGLNYGLVFWGEQHISSGLAALLQATLPAFGLVFAHFHLPGERLSWTKIGGVVLGVCGVAVVFSNQLAVAGRQALAGCIALILSAAFAAYSNVLVKKYGKKLNPAILSAGQMFFGLLLLFAVGLPLEGNPFRFHWTTMAVIALLYLAVVGSVIAFFALLLACAEHGRHEIDAHRTRDPGRRRHPRHAGPERRIRLAHPRRRRHDHARHRADRSANKSVPIRFIRG